MRRARDVVVVGGGSFSVVRFKEGSGFLFFFFNDTATTEIYTLSLHDALPILASSFLVDF